MLEELAWALPLLILERRAVKGEVRAASGGVSMAGAHGSGCQPLLLVSGVPSPRIMDVAVIRGLREVGSGRAR